MQEEILLISLSLLIGLVLGALGSGGAILTLPVLVYAAHLELRVAVGVSQLVVGTAALFGAALQSRQGWIRWRPVWVYGALGIPAAKVGHLLANQLNPATLMVFFGLVVSLAGWRMLRPIEKANGTWNWPVSMAAACLVGLLTGLLGVGGGFLLVPALILYAGLDAKEATATSLPVIALNCAIGAWDNQRFWASQVSLAALFLVGTLVGTFLGIGAARRLPEQRLRGALGVTLIVVGVFVVGKSLARGVASN